MIIAAMERDIAIGIVSLLHISWEEKEKYPYNVSNASEIGSLHRHAQHPQVKHHTGFHKLFLQVVKGLLLGHVSFPDSFHQ